MFGNTSWSYSKTLPVLAALCPTIWRNIREIYLWSCAALICISPRLLPFIPGMRGNDVCRADSLLGKKCVLRTRVEEPLLC